MDTRGQPVQVGVIILFGFLVIAFATFQAVIVPQQNGEVEYGHNLEVQGQLTELRGSLLRASSTGEGYPVTVPLGTTYPARVFAVSPAPASGTLRTGSSGGGATLGVANASALEEETGQYWDGSTKAYATTGLVYEPNYNVYQQAPTTVYENTVLYNRAPGGEVAVLAEQRVVDGRSLDLTVLQGTYQASSSGTVSVDVSSPSAAPRTVLVQRKGGPVEVSFPTALSLSTWEDLLDDELAANGGYVTDVSKSGDVVTVTMQGTDGSGTPIRYRLTVPVAGVGSNVPATSTAYATTVSGDGTSIPEGASQQVVAEVRNEFNAPESGVGTCATVKSGDPGSIQENPTTATTGEDGRVDFTYLAPNDVRNTDTVTVIVGYDCDGGDPRPGSPKVTKATFEIDVYDTGSGSGGGGGGGSSGTSPVVNQLSVSQGNNDRQFDVSYDVTDSDSDLTNVTLVLEDSAGDALDVAVVYDSGGTGAETGTETLQRGNSEVASQVRLIAKDATGNRVEETEPTP